MLDAIGGRVAFDDLIESVLAAGELALGLFRAGVGNHAQKKPDRSPVTEADRAVERHLREFVARRFPNAGFFGEEEGGSAQSAGLRFVVDPIDGTRAFMRGLPTWSILVGLEFAGQPVAGVAYMPAAGDLFSAVQGHGAYANGRPVRLSATRALEDALVCHGGLAQFTDAGCEAQLITLARGTYTQRGLSDFAGYRALLLGQADAVIDPGIQPYDIAAAAVLVREAGGRLTAPDGRDTIYAGYAVASNGHVHDALLGLLRS
jgi:histidinol phosphatase-like enzyme (inositol monophosphatase family)